MPMDRDIDPDPDINIRLQDPVVLCGHGRYLIRV